MASKHPEACEAWALITELLFSHRASLPSVAAEFELSPAQCHVLRAIEPGHPVQMNQLAETLSCDASNITGLVDRLEVRGLVRRRPSSEDRRVKVLDLTAAGCRLRAVVLERLTEPPDTLERLTAEERRVLVKLLKRLVRE